MPFEDVYFNVTAVFEGGYAKDPADAGGETFRGVSRKSHPAWSGWQLIDAAKRDGAKTAKAIDAYFKNDGHMGSLVAKVYENGYWKPLNGEPELPDRVKQKLFDASVHMGLKNAAKILQKSLNAAGASPPLAEDGAIGPKTRGAALAADENRLLGGYAAWQAAYYDDLIRRKPQNEKYRKGWMKRAQWIPNKG
jgi:lysozyme family protein